MRQVERDDGLFAIDRPPLLMRGTGLIDGVIGNQYFRRLRISFRGGSLEGMRSGFPVPREHLDYFLEILGLESPTQLKGAEVCLYHTGLGGRLYGISP